MWAQYSFLAIFIALTFAQTKFRKRALSRSSMDWWIDGVSNFIHLVVLPLLQVHVLMNLYRWAAPGLEGGLNVGVLGSLLFYGLLDYLWYWNHRWLHSYTWIWNLHAVHHSAIHVDIFTTPRNSVWSHFVEVYVWLISIMIYALQDPSWFLTFASIGLILNFWSHTEFTFSRESLAYKIVSIAFVTPHEHFWHHSTDHANTNYATVFSFWDKMHGTWYSPTSLPTSYGNEYLPTAFQQLVLPNMPGQALAQSPHESLQPSLG